MDYPSTITTALYENILWMVWNTSLAYVSVLAGLWLSRTRSKPTQIVLGLIWFFFVPNTLYILTDIIHLVAQSGRVSPLVDIFLLLWYAVTMGMGIIAYLWSFRLMIDFLKSRLHVSMRYLQRGGLMMNALIGVAVGMGRFARTNSWHVLTDPVKVIQDIGFVFREPTVTLFSLVYASGAICLFYLFFWEKMKSTHSTFPSSTSLRGASL